MPQVTAVIPTHGRPELVCRAVRSCLSQTLKDIEVFVIIDGSDPRSVEALGTFREDRRLHVVHMGGENRGPSACRNEGVSRANSDWIAFLDDDDEWLESKLESQRGAALQSGLPHPIVSCRFITRNNEGDLCWPRRLPEPHERLDEYLFCQRSIFGGEGMILPSTILAPRQLLQEVPFNTNVRRHQDIDWLLRVIQMPGSGIVFPSNKNPMAIWHRETGHNRMSETTDWKLSYDWAIANVELLSSRALGGFLLTWASVAAAQSRDWTGFHILLREAMSRGRPRGVDLTAHFIIWFVPETFRRILSILLEKFRS